MCLRRHTGGYYFTGAPLISSHWPPARRCWILSSVFTAQINLSVNFWFFRASSIPWNIPNRIVDIYAGATSVDLFLLETPRRWSPARLSQHVPEALQVFQSHCSCSNIRPVYQKLLFSHLVRSQSKRSIWVGRARRPSTLQVELAVNPAAGLGEMCWLLPPAGMKQLGTEKSPFARKNKASAAKKSLGSFSSRPIRSWHPDTTTTEETVGWGQSGSRRPLKQICLQTILHFSAILRLITSHPVYSSPLLFIILDSSNKKCRGVASPADEIWDLFCNILSFLSRLQRLLLFCLMNEWMNAWTRLLDMGYNLESLHGNVLFFLWLTFFSLCLVIQSSQQEL